MYISHVCSLAAFKILLPYLFEGMGWGVFWNSYFSGVIFSFVATDVSHLKIILKIVFCCKEKNQSILLQMSNFKDFKHI